MKLIEIFNQLTGGELALLALGGADKGGILDKNQDRVVGLINTGLTDLYTRFTIRKGYLLLELQPGIGSYSLTSAFAVNGKRSKELVRYIIDSVAEPFQDDLAKVERVITDAGYEMALNMDGDSQSVHTPSNTVLRLPRMMVPGSGLECPSYLKTEHLEVHYRANHPVIGAGGISVDAERTEVDLPRAYLQALLYFVAARVHAPMGMNQEFYTGNIYSQKYEQECARLGLANVEIDTAVRNTRAERGGWV